MKIKIIESLEKDIEMFVNGYVIVILQQQKLNLPDDLWVMSLEFIFI